MKSIFLPALLAASILMPCITQAGTLENLDLNDYSYVTYGPGGGYLSYGIIYSESVDYEVCDAGCNLSLLNTGQTITMKPDDYVVIRDGVMKRKGY